MSQRSLVEDLWGCYTVLVGESDMVPAARETVGELEFRLKYSIDREDEAGSPLGVVRCCFWDR